MRRIAWIAIIVAAVNIVVPVAATQASAPGPRFHPIACPHGAFEPKLDVECGYVEVPENRARPNGRTIRVAAAVIHTKAANPRPDPIMFLDGGPSFGAISDFAPNVYFADAAYAADRDVILVDTRGTGISQPRLGCRELDEAEVTTFYSGESINSEAATIYPEAIRQCRDRLTADGVDVRAYNSAESAADFEALRSALGVDRWNVLGISADGTTALTYLRLFPGAIRSAVIDSGWSTQMLPVLDYDRGLAAQLDKVFAGCAANDACNAAYPELRDAFFRMVRRLQEHPVTITFPDFQPEPVSLVLDGVGLYADAIYNIFPGDRFNPSEIPGLLDDLWRVTHGELVEVYRENFGTGPVENSHTDPAQHQPVTSQIPTLVLAGEYDPGVPANIVQQVSVGLSRSHYYEMPASPHLQLASFNQSSDCARDIATQFLTDPGRTPDSSCVAELPPLDFTPQ